MDANIAHIPFSRYCMQPLRHAKERSLRQASPDKETHPSLVFHDAKWRHGALRFADSTNHAVRQGRSLRLGGVVTVEVSFVYPQMESREGFRPVLSSAGSGQDHACGANRGHRQGLVVVVLCLHYPTAFVRLLTTCQEIVRTPPCLNHETSVHDWKHVQYCNYISFDCGIWKMALRLIRLTKWEEGRG